MVRNQATKTLSIAGLARAGGVGVETVRYYQRRGLLETPERDGRSSLGGGIRRYGADHVRKLRFIRSAQSAGFSLTEIAELLALDAKIAELAAARSALAWLERACAAEKSGPCPILAAFDSYPAAN